MESLRNAFEAFWDYVDAVSLGAVALALACQLGKVAARTRAWRNIVAASYPEATVRWRTILGAYLAGTGVNAIVPARAGDLLKLYLVKHRVDGATYPTLAATLLVETLFDFAVATVLVVWAVTTGVLPGLDVLPSLPQVDWLWLFGRPRLAAAVAAVALVLGFVAGIWAARRVASFRRRVAQGFAILRPPSGYLRRVIPWQALDWAFRLATVYFFLRAFGLHADVENALRVQVTQSLSTILPLTPGGIGTEQALLVYVFRGDEPARALLSFSVGMKLVLTAANVVLGFTAIALMLRTLRWRGAVAAQEAEARAAGEPEGRAAS
ncbi:MAG TPA: lysylphosphatidylglycerol synthase transmembrane domain-containing protein [Gaiellaceae bacterium]|nr:lysylphosphatidylglycerol synthase transmembrane domain-containing protein [Gaiellaceae bacterium]